MPASAGYSQNLAQFFRTFRQVLIDLCRFLLFFIRPRIALVLLR
jgi:hypothetical protein